MTDGFVGNDMEIISEVQKHTNARVFAFGIGSSVNRFLLDKVAEVGRGDVEYVSLSDDGSAAARRFHERVRNPLLTDISIDWNGLPVADVYPQRIPDLFGAKPVILTGRFTAAGRATIRLKGKMAGNDFVREIPVELPETMASHDVLASLWARARIESLMDQDYSGAQSGNMRPDLKETITQLGIEYRLMTQFTSFVAVEEMIVTDGGQPRRIDVPVEVPEGVNPNTVMTNEQTVSVTALSTGSIANLGTLQPAPSPKRAKGAGDGGRGYPPPPNQPPTVRAITVDIPKSPEEQKLERVRPKLHPSILALIERVRRKEGLPGAGEAAFVQGGKAFVQVWLTEKSDEARAKLNELGFEIMLDPKSSKLTVGRLPVDKLEALAALDFVKYISPQVTK